jgi:leucyl-tRNA synthetase
MMVFTNHCYKVGTVTPETASTFYQILAPFAPHLAEELWALSGNSQSIGTAPWPFFIPSFLTEDVVEYPVSFNGKVRFKLELPVGLSSKEIEEAALKSDLTKKWTEGNTIVKIIVVPGKIVNIVLRHKT